MSPPPALDALTLGEAMVLFIAEETGALAQVQRFRRAVAGAELNVAVGLARLGLRVGYVSRVGADSFGEHLRQFMRAEGIDTRHVQVDAQHPSGFMLKSLETDGRDPRIEYFRRGSAASHLNLGDRPAAGAAAARHLHVTGICPALSASARELVFAMAAEARAAGRSVSFDPNLRPRLWPSEREMVDTLIALAAHASLVMPGLDEGELLSGRQGAAAVADFFLERGAAQVVVKLGAQGAYFADGNARGQWPGVRVPRVVDTVGAGDGFAVGVISALLEGLDLAAATARGNAIGARVVQFPGDSDGLPTRAELDALMRSSG